MKKALVCGAGGFIGGHLVKKLKREGYWVRGVDIKAHEFAPTQADEFLLLDLREAHNCWQALSVDGGTFDEVYQLAADMGGMGFIHTAECEIMHNSALINVNMIDTAARIGVPRYFFSSSVCVYRDMEPGEPALTEADAVPAHPDNEYGWEKLYAERMAQTYARHYPIQVRIARFENCYGPEGTWRGGREKAPAAMCRKVAEAADGGTVDVWGDGTAIRNFTYVDDMVEAIYRLTQSDLEGAVNLGGEEYVTVAELVQTVIDVSGKQVGIRYVEGPVGVQSRNFSKARSRLLG
ncbi:MAG: NAD-dependent epimerase/dehydratase family protein, partial [Anaerolineae bacterium]